MIAKLLNNVVCRFDERIRMGNLSAVVLDIDMVKTIDEKYGYLSRFIVGHSHSDTFAAAAPLTVETLRAEIEEFNELKSRLKELKKQRSASAKR